MPAVAVPDRPDPVAWLVAGGPGHDKERPDEGARCRRHRLPRGPGWCARRYLALRRITDPSEQCRWCERCPAVIWTGPEVTARDSTLMTVPPLPPGTYELTTLERTGANFFSTLVVG